MERIKVLIVRPGEKPVLTEISHTLETLHEIVGGTIQAVYPFDDPVAILCDDEGKFKGYVPNRALIGEDGEPYDILAGTFIICGLTAENFGSLSDELAGKYREKFLWPEMFMRTLGGNIVWFRTKPGEEPRIIG
mgnify:CR=1 FL=1